MKDLDSVDFGTVKIHKDVIASLAKNAALEIPGVARLGESVNGLIEILGFKSNKEVKVEIFEPNEVKVTVYLIVKYGYHLSEIAGYVQENIRKAIEKMTELNLREVNVVIKGLDPAKK